MAEAFLERTCPVVDDIRGRASERQTVDHKTSIRDAAEALISALKAAERDIEIEAGNANSPQEVTRKRGSPEAIPPVYVIIERAFMDRRQEEEHIVGVYINLVDANNAVDNHCSINAKGDDPDEDFLEEIAGEGHNWYQWFDDTGFGFEVYISKQEVNKVGSKPANDWGRPIGLPLP